MKRGDVVVVALPGDTGKPRPAVIVQSDLFPHTTSVALVPVTSTLVTNSIRISVTPDERNGLREHSQLMVDRVTNVQRGKVRQTIGVIDDITLEELASRLALFLSLT